LKYYYYPGFQIQGHVLILLTCKLLIREQVVVKLVKSRKRYKTETWLLQITDRKWYKLCRSTFESYSDVSRFSIQNCCIFSIKTTTQ